MHAGNSNHEKQGKRIGFIWALTAVALTAALLTLASCGGGGGGSSDVGPATGVYRGTSGAGNNVLGLVFSDGRYYFLYSTPANPNVVMLINSGSGASSNGSFSSSSLLSVPINQMPGMFSTGNIANGNFAATYSPGSALNGTFTYLPSGSGGSNVTMSFDVASQATATLPQVAKTYSGTFSFYYPGGNNLNNYTPTTTFTVGSDGSISGNVACYMTPVNSTTTTCDVTGTIAPRSDVNAYDISITISSTTGGQTPLDGSYTGAAFYDAVTGSLNIAGIASNNHAIGFK